MHANCYSEQSSSSTSAADVQVEPSPHYTDDAANQIQQQIALAESSTNYETTLTAADPDPDYDLPPSTQLQQQTSIQIDPSPDSDIPSPDYDGLASQLHTDLELEPPSDYDIV